MEATNNFSEAKENFNVTLRKEKRAEILKARRVKNFENIQREVVTSNMENNNIKSQIFDIFQWFKNQ